MNARKLVPAFGRSPWRHPAERAACQTSKPDGASRVGLNSTTEYRSWATDAETAATALAGNQSAILFLVTVVPAEPL